MPTEALERELAGRLGVKHVIAFAYSRHALIGMLDAVGVSDGGEVVLSPLNCKVVPLAALAARAKPVYADISITTLNLSPEAVAAAIGPRTRAVLFQHTYGNSAGLRDVAAVLSAKQVTLFEDCAHCLPTVAAQPAVGRSAIFSINLRKPLPAGSGGFAATDDDALAAGLRVLRDGYPRRTSRAESRLRAEMVAHRWVLGPRMYWPLLSLSRRLTPYYRTRPLAVELASEIDEQAFRISDHQARAGLRALRHVEADARHRRTRSADYAELLRGLDGIEMPSSDASHALYFFPVLVPRKQEFLERARRRSIEIVAWPMSTPIYPIENVRELAAYGYEPGSCPVAEDVAQRLVGLPTDPRVGPRERDAVIDLVRSHLEG